MPRDFPRSRRVEEQIQRILSDLLRANVRDPRLKQAIITDVRVSRDLSVAWIGVSALDPQHSQQELMAAFASAAGFLRSALAGALTVRHVPELRFEYDETLQHAAHMDELIAGAVAREAGANDIDDDNDQDG